MAKKVKVEQQGIDFAEFFNAIEDIEKEARIPQEVMIDALKEGLKAAYKKQFGETAQVIVSSDSVSKKFYVFTQKEVVAFDDFENFDTQVTVDEAKTIDPEKEVGDFLLEEVDPFFFSRIAAQTAKQVILSRITEKKKEMILSEMSSRTGEIVQAIIRRKEGQTVYVEIINSQLEGVMMIGDQIPTEKYEINDIIKVYVKKIKESLYGSTQVIVSRSCPGFVRRLIEMEVPEVKSKLVEIVNVVREPGERTKVAVRANDPNVDAVGSCIGNKGIRINDVVAELGGERIDVIEYTDDPLEYIPRALSPATVLWVGVKEDEKTAKVLVPDEKLSLAIGKRGQNARLAAKLTGWKIDVKPYSSQETAEPDAE